MTVNEFSQRSDRRETMALRQVIPGRGTHATKRRDELRKALSGSGLTAVHGVYHATRGNADA